MATKGDKAADKAQAQAEKVLDQEQAQGFRGTKVDPIDNEAYSLESGPDSPTILEQREALAAAA